MVRAAFRIGLLSAMPILLVALTGEQIDMLKDGGGWEYLTITDVNNGFETQHVCFDEKGRGQCTGKLILRRNGTFVQTVTGHGKSMDRHGTYTVDGDTLNFADEFGTKDGPYTISLDPRASTLDIATTQAGITIKVHLMLEREFRKGIAQAAKQKS